MKKRKKLILIIVPLILLFVFDRYSWMPKRVRQSWFHESGRGLGDPLVYKWDFTLNGSEIVFKDNKSKEDYPFVFRNRQSKFYLLGCYFGNLYIYDKVRNEVIKYSSQQ